MYIGVTGVSGFIGHHLANYLSEKNYTLIPITKDDFYSSEKLGNKLRNCNIIIHLAEITQGSNKEVYNGNFKLASQLLTTIEGNNLTPAVIFLSSKQEEMDNSYGRSKTEATNLFINWAKINNANFTALNLPNIFGPFCKPNKDSVIATLCYQLTHNQEPVIQFDRTLELIYINGLVEKIHELIKKPSKEHRIYPQADRKIRISEILLMLKNFKQDYFEKHIIPRLRSSFEIDLFNTFRSYIDAHYFPVKSIVQSDERGNLIEAVKEKTGGQMFYSLTIPGKTRGEHYHRRKMERFYVVKGLALIKIRRVGSNKIFEYKLSGQEPSFVDIPVHCAHNITNIGNEDLLTLFWTNELFNTRNPDTFPEKV